MKLYHGSYLDIECIDLRRSFPILFWNRKSNSISHKNRVPCLVDKRSHDILFEMRPNK